MKQEYYIKIHLEHAKFVRDVQMNFLLLNMHICICVYIKVCQKKNECFSFGTGTLKRWLVDTSKKVSPSTVIYFFLIIG